MTEIRDQIIRIVSPNGLSDQEAERIARAFAEHLGYESYQLKQDSNSALLGGFVVYTDGKRYDYSLKGRLTRIAGNIVSPLHAEGENGDLDPAESLKDEIRRKSAEIASEESDSPSLSFLWDIQGESISEEEKQDDLHLVLDEYINRVRGNHEDLHRQLIDEVGTVRSVGDGIAHVSGLENVMNDELLIFDSKSYGIAMNLEEDEVGVVLLGDSSGVSEGSICKRSSRTISVPGGKGMMGRVVNALGEPIDGLGPVDYSERWPIESPAPSVIVRQPVTQPLYTGITAVDAMTPIGLGQRELIIGDRQTGKTSIAIDTILNQKGRNVRCVYVAIGQKMSTLAVVVNTLRSYGAMNYTTVVLASASESAAMQYIAPYAGCAIAESWMREDHADVLVVYDDLTKHAQAYRAISLLLRRPPGREAFPGDVFYLHSRLLERACRLCDEEGGGSITALPIVETQAGDISAYIPTNVISITDGQIYLETDLFFAGQRPAINVGLSVSRVGGAAQAKAMKKVAGSLRINLAQYKEIAAFSQFGSDLDEETQRQIAKGDSLNEVLVQREHRPRRMSESVILLYMATEGLLIEVPKEDLRSFCDSFLAYMNSVHERLLSRIEKNGTFEEEEKEELEQILKDYLPQWKHEQHNDLED